MIAKSDECQNQLLEERKLSNAHFSKERIRLFHDYQKGERVKVMNAKNIILKSIKAPLIFVSVAHFC